MKDIGTVKIHCISETLSPLTHMMGTAGNEAIINREFAHHDGAVKSIPVISGNAIRHRMVREPGALFLVEKLGLYGKLTIDQANYMFTGGTLTESSISDNLKKIADMQKLFPLFRLLGGSLRNQIIGGSLFCLRGVMICEENRDVVHRSLPEGYDLPEDGLKSCEDFITDYQYTRGEASKRGDADDLMKSSELNGDASSNLMIYNGQAIVPGAFFYHGFILYNVSRMEIGSLLHSLELWKDQGATLGGQSRIGHGRMDTRIIIENSEDFFDAAVDSDQCVKDYIEHVENHIEGCVAWLNETFPEKRGKNDKKLEGQLLP